MMFGKKRVYADYASATPVHPRALDAACRASSVFANPGGIHAESITAKAHLQGSRERIAKCLACKAREIVFTSGLTEANALTILGFARALELSKKKLAGTHWLTSAIEHSSVLECFAEVKRMGAGVEYLAPDSRGIIAPDVVARALRPETVFVSVGWANNELGTVQPLAEIARALRAHEKRNQTKISFHSDAGQSPLYLSAHVHTLGVDMLCLGSGKLYGPRGIGCAYVGARTQLSAISFGGGQERGLRSGTEDTALAAGFAEALDIVQRERKEEGARVRGLRDNLAREIVAQIPGAILNGSASLTASGPTHVLPHMLNVSIPGTKSGEYLALQLDRAGISLSTKSACREGESASHVVEALGGPKWRARNTLRFSLGRGTTRREVKRVIETLRAIATPRHAT